MIVTTCIRLDGLYRRWYWRALEFCSLEWIYNTDFNMHDSFDGPAQWFSCIAGLFRPAKFLCFMKKSDFVRFIFVLTYTMQTTPTLMLLLCVFNFLFFKAWRTRKRKFFWRWVLNKLSGLLCFIEKFFQGGPMMRIVDFEGVGRGWRGKATSILVCLQANRLGESAQTN